MNSLETFIELIEKDIFKPDNYRGIRNKISKEEKEALRNIQNDPSRTYRIQDKSSRFVILENDDYINKIDYQLGRSSLEQLEKNLSNTFSKKVLEWIE